MNNNKIILGTLTILLVFGVLSCTKQLDEVVPQDAISKDAALKDPNDPILQEMHRIGISGGFGHNAVEIADKMRRDLGLETNTLMKRALDKTESVAKAETPVLETNDEESPF